MNSETNEFFDSDPDSDPDSDSDSLHQKNTGARMGSGMYLKR
jgi:hypothetical protein